MKSIKTHEAHYIIIVAKQRSLRPRPTLRNFYFCSFFLATNLLFGRNRVRGRNCLMIWKTCSISLYSETTEKRRQQRVQSANIDSSVTVVLSLNLTDCAFWSLFRWDKKYVRFLRVLLFILLKCTHRSHRQFIIFCPLVNLRLFERPVVCAIGCF